MTVSMQAAAFCGAVMLLFVAHIAPSWADSCTDLGTKVTNFQNEIPQMNAELDRVNHMSSQPYTDAALCRVLNKAYYDGKQLMQQANRQCFASAANYNQFEGNLDDATNSIAGFAIAFHCGLHF